MQIIIQIYYQMDLQNTLLKKVRLSKRESPLNKLNVLPIHVVYLLCPYGSDHITCYLSVQVCRAKLVMREALRAHHHAFFRPFKKHPQAIKLWMYSQQRKCSWNRYNVAWPFRGDPSSDHAMPTAAVCNITERS